MFSPSHPPADQTQSFGLSSTSPAPPGPPHWPPLLVSVSGYRGAQSQAQCLSARANTAPNQRVGLCSAPSPKYPSREPGRCPGTGTLPPGVVIGGWVVLKWLRVRSGLKSSLLAGGASLGRAGRTPLWGGVEEVMGRDPGDQLGSGGLSGHALAPSAAGRLRPSATLCWFLLPRHGHGAGQRDGHIRTAAPKGVPEHPGTEVWRKPWPKLLCLRGCGKMISPWWRGREEQGWGFGSPGLSPGAEEGACSGWCELGTAAPKPLPKFLPCSVPGAELCQREGKQPRVLLGGTDPGTSAPPTAVLGVTPGCAQPCFGHWGPRRSQGRPTSRNPGRAGAVPAWRGWPRGARTSSWLRQPRPCPVNEG